MPKGIKNGSSLELACTLCPKNPSFSDVSHLLTHISSKSHLSHRFKLQIQAQCEPEAREKLDSFDYWYHDNKLDKMLSERLAAKEQKKIAKERKATTFKASIKSVKNESTLVEEPLASTPTFRAPVPRMHLWPTILANSSKPNRDWEEDTLYSTPTPRRKVPHFADAETTPAGDIFAPPPATPWKFTGSEGIEKLGQANEKVDENLSDNTKLKGILWPGMNLFDSATPEMKRMRNQRKDSSILEQMIATSIGVEPTEMIYYPDGQISHSRDIFGPLSTENSPNKVEYPTPRKRKTRKTAALADISVNAPRIRAPRPKKAAVAQTSLQRPSAAMQPRSPPLHPFIQAPTLNPLGFGQRFIPTSEEDEEFRMTVGDMDRKRPFGIFQDAPEVSPGRTESSLEDHRFDFSGDRLTSGPQDFKMSHFISPTPAARQPTTRGSGKENAKSGLSPQVHVHQTISTSASHIYPGQIFYDPSLNPLYSQAWAGGFRYVTHPHQQQMRYTQDSRPPPSRFHTTMHGEYRPIHAITRPSIQHDTGPSGSHGHSMHYGV